MIINKIANFVIGFVLFGILVFSGIYYITGINFIGPYLNFSNFGPAKKVVFPTDNSSFDLTFLKESSEYNAKYICAESNSDFNDKIKNYFSGMGANQYFSDEIKPSNITENDMYYEIKMDRTIEGKSKWGVIKCPYFNQTSSYTDWKNTDNLKLGTSNYVVDAKSFDNIVAFLVKADIVSISGFNSGMSFYKTNTVDSANQIVRVDEGELVVADDTSFRRDITPVKYTYIFNKATKEVFVSAEFK